MLAENSAMLGMIRALGLPYTASTRYGETQVFILLPGHRKEGVFVQSAYKPAA